MSYNFAHYYSNINFIINYMFKFYSIFKPPLKYSHIIFSLKDRIKKCYYIIKFNIWTKHKEENRILQYFMAHFIS